MAYTAGSALQKVVFLIFAQLFSRIITFAANLWIARNVGVANFGLASVNLFLIDAILMMPSRDGLRKAVLRFAPRMQSPGLKDPRVQQLLLKPAADTQHDPELDQKLRECRVAIERRKQVINLAWCSPLVASLLGVACYLGATSLSAAQHASDEHEAAYRSAVLMTVVSSVLATMADPILVLVDSFLLFRARTVIETVTLIVKALSTALVVRHSGPHVTSIALASVVYGGSIFLLYFAYGVSVVVSNKLAVRAGVPLHEPFLVSFADLLPQRAHTATLSKESDSHAPEAASEPSSGLAARFAGAVGSDAGLVKNTWAFCTQGASKLLLTEGEKAVLVALAVSDESKGVYALVQNLGSLAARLLLQPLEESCNSEFSMLLGDRSIHKGAKEKDQANLTEAARLLSVLLKLVLTIGLLFASFGPSYSFVLFDVLYGAKWSQTDAPTVLAWYCGYVLLMAVNGTTEAFLTASIPHDRMATYNRWLAIFSGTYLGVTALFIRWGAVGIVWANCINMIVRIAYSSSFILHYFAEVPAARARLIADVAPSPIVAALFAISAAVTAFSSRAFDVAHCGTFKCYGAHVGIGLVCLIALAAGAWRAERPFLGAVRSIVGKKRRS